MEKMSIYDRIKFILNLRCHVQKIEQNLRYAQRYDQLINQALNSEKQGVSDTKYCKNEIIVSLTTYSKRLYDVAATIESIMQGSLKPNHIILWLGEENKDVILPKILQNQQKRGLEISYCRDIRSYTKLIPTLRKYPKACIITIDDDALYHYDLVEKLVNEHCQYPNHIIANRIHRVKLDKNGFPLKYIKWTWNDTVTDDSPLNFLTGVGGVLYPPQSLHPEVFNESVFLDICKYADDIWFYAMALKAGTRIKKCYTHNKKGEDYLLNEELQDTGLYNTNVGMSGKNDEQFISVFERYGLWECLKFQ